MTCLQEDAISTHGLVLYQAYVEFCYHASRENRDAQR